MLITRLTATLSVALLGLAAGCSSSPQGNASSAAVEPVETEIERENSVSATKPNMLAIAPPDHPNPAIQQQTGQYLKRLAAKGYTKENHGVWMQDSDTLLANHRGTVPLPAASITKVATTLAALSTFGPDRQFITQIGATGPIENGVLRGDLVIQGAEDPFFVWEEAIVLGNVLNQKGIKRVTGNLIITDKFYMNYESDSLKSGNLLKVGLNARLWPAQVQTQYQTLPPGTPQPQVQIDGSVRVSPSVPDNVQPLARHYSFPLAKLLKKMNQYSNNKMAQMLANSVGGAKVVAQKAAEISGVPPEEIQLVNGSGLAVENRISPRAAIAMFLAIERYLKPLNMTVADIFTIVGQDEGILASRKLPSFAVVKSGSLNNVSALAGALPTEQGTVWFAIMNEGFNLEGFRAEQEAFLQTLVKQRGAVEVLPPELLPSAERKNKNSRSEIVN